MSVGKNLQVSGPPHVGGSPRDAARFDCNLGKLAGQVAICMENGWFACAP
jgi:hypothetical protein